MAQLFGELQSVMKGPASALIEAGPSAQITEGSAKIANDTIMGVVGDIGRAGLDEAEKIPVLGSGLQKIENAVVGTKHFIGDAYDKGLSNIRNLFGISKDTDHLATLPEEHHEMLGQSIKDSIKLNHPSKTDQMFLTARVNADNASRLNKKLRAIFESAADDPHLNTHLKSIAAFDLDAEGGLKNLTDPIKQKNLPEEYYSKGNLTPKFKNDFAELTNDEREYFKSIQMTEPKRWQLYQLKARQALANAIADAPTLSIVDKERLLRPYFNSRLILPKAAEQLRAKGLFTEVEDVLGAADPIEGELAAEEAAIAELPEEERLKMAAEEEAAAGGTFAAIEQPDEIKQLLSPAPKPAAAFKQITALTREEEELIRNTVDEKLPNATQAEKDTVIRKIEQEEIEARRKAAPPKVDPVGDPSDIGGVKRLLAGTEKAEAKIARDADLERTRLKAVDAESRAFLKPADIDEVETSITTPPKGFEDEPITTEGRLLSDLTEEEKLGAQFRDFTDEELDALPTGEPLGPTRIQQIKDFFNSDEFKIAMTGSVVGGTLSAGIAAALSRIKAHVDKLDAPTLKQIKDLATTVATVDRTIQQLKKNYGDLLKQYNKPSNSKVDNRTTKNQLNRMKAEIAKQSQLVNKERSMLTKEIITAAKDVQQQVMDDRKAAVKGTLSDRSQKGIDDGVLKIAPDKQERYSVPIKVYINNNNQSPESNFQNKNAK